MCHHLKEKGCRRTLVPQCTSPCSMWYGVKSSMKVQWRPSGSSRDRTFSSRQQWPLMTGPKGLGMPRCFPSTSMFTCKDVREEGHCLSPLHLEELGDVHDVLLRQAQLLLQHLTVPVNAALGVQ
ncbi:hypothetical protein MC885_002636, partial [Smutsia gigantea]